MAYKLIVVKLIIVTVAQRDLGILSDDWEVLGSIVDPPWKSRGKEGRKNECTTQKSSPQHCYTVGAMRKKLGIKERSPVDCIYSNSPSSTRRGLSWPRSASPGALHMVSYVYCTLNQPDIE